MLPPSHSHSCLAAMRASWAVGSLSGDAGPPTNIARKAFIHSVEYSENVKGFIHACSAGMP